MASQISENACISATAVCLIGGDRRQSYMARRLAREGMAVRLFAVSEPEGNADVAGDITVYEELGEALKGVDAVILPFPLSPDGITLNCGAAVKPKLSEIFSEIAAQGVGKVFGGALREGSESIAERHGVTVFDYGRLEEIALKNAVPTAEGAVEIAMRELDVTLCGSVCAVIGYGRCGSVLARLLASMGCGEVRGIARSPKDRAKMYTDGVRAFDISQMDEALKGVDVIFNTVPFRVLDAETLHLVPRSAPIIDIASAPGGTDREYAALLGLRTVHALSLPGKYAPRTAADIICDALLPML